MRGEWGERMNRESNLRPYLGNIFLFKITTFFHFKAMNLATYLKKDYIIIRLAAYTLSIYKYFIYFFLDFINFFEHFFLRFFVFTIFFHQFSFSFYVYS